MAIVDFEKSQITIGTALDKFGNEKSTKGNKTTIFHIPNELKQLLQQWNTQQKEELAQFEIEQTEEQLLFTFFYDKRNITQRLHTDYLNYCMKSIERRHKHLTHATPHKLRHTGATLAKQSGVALEQISEALTHSDIKATEIYVNTPNVVDLKIYEAFNRGLKKEQTK